MPRRRRAALALGAALAASAALAAPARAPALPRPPVITYDAVQRYGSHAGYIAHEFGSIDGYAYTNTLEAFNRSYAAGFRLFECDLVQIADGTVIVAHDRTEPLYGLAKSFHEATWPDLRHAHYRGKYTMLTSRGLIRLMRSHRDVRVILDTKWAHIAILRKLVLDARGDRSVLDRMIPHVTTAANIEAVKAVYPWHGAILALYRMGAVTDDRIVELVRQYRLSAVMMVASQPPSQTQRYFTQELYDRLKRERIPTYVHGVGTAQGVAQFRALGVGVYSDGWFFASPAAATAESVKRPFLVLPPEGDGSGE